MTSTAIREVGARLSCDVRYDEPLARYTTYRIGGPAAALVLPEHVEDVITALRFAAESGTDWVALGLGSNLLISDSGFGGLAIRLGKGMDRIVAGEGGEEQVWRVEAGVPTPRLAQRTAKAGWAGVHRLIGVPGTVGGGVFMNAGAHGQDFSQVVRAVELVRSDGTQHSVRGEDVVWRYRGSGLEGSIVVGATLALTAAEPTVLMKDIRKHFRWRKAGTPFTEPCCGSVFRNPIARAGPSEASPKTAGQLIDACGLKGFRIGGAEVSTLHANYIVNLGGAKASDVLAVIEAVRERVNREFAVELALEVGIIE